MPAAHSFVRQDTPRGPWVPIGSAAEGETSFRDLSAPCGQTLAYRVMGSNAISESPWSSPVSASTTCAPTTVMTLTVGDTTAHSIALAWTATAGGQTSFLLLRSIDGINGWSPIANLPVNATAFTDLNLPPGTRYYYRLQAVNAGGDAYSTVVFGETKFSTMLPLVRK